MRLGAGQYRASVVYRRKKRGSACRKTPVSGIPETGAWGWRLFLFGGGEGYLDGGEAFGDRAFFKDYLVDAEHALEIAKGGFEGGPWPRGWP